MSELYDDDLANEERIFTAIEAAEESVDIDKSSVKAALNVSVCKGKGGRPYAVEPIKLVAWRQAHNATIKQTAEKWRVSEATVKNLCKKYGDAARHERARWECERLDKELHWHEVGILQIYNRNLSRCLSLIELSWAWRCETAKGTDQEASVAVARDAALSEAEQEFRAGWEISVGAVPAIEPPLKLGG